jgi:YidC/Oxa1 family membrane protein insertase
LEALYYIIIYPIVQIIEIVFVFAWKLFKESGISIIAVSAAVSLLCLPLYNAAEKLQNIERDIQKKLKPKVDKIKAVFKGDEQYMILSTYYRQNHYHPVYAMRNTFSLLIQIPFFIAAYSYLSHLTALEGAGFLFISDLGAPDALLKIGDGGGGGINLLPFVMTAVNLSSGALYTKGFPARDKVQVYGMAAVFLVLLYNSPSGLVLYWTLNNVFSLAKNCYHKIKNSRKNIVLRLFVSVFLAALALYVLFIYNTEHSYLRVMITLLLCFTAAIPWIWPFVKKFFSKRKYALQTQKLTTLIFILSCACIWMLLGVVLPSLLIAASPGEFSYIDTYKSPFIFLTNTTLQAFGFFIFWPVCLYTLFSVKIKRIFALVFMAAAVSAVFNAFLFPGNYGLISIALEFAKDVEHEYTDIFINAAVTISVMVIFICLAFKYPVKFVLPAFVICFASFITLSLANMSKIQNTYMKISAYHTDADKSIENITPIFHLSKTGKNVVVIMLDRAISGLMPYIFTESPELNDEYDGFVFYPNTVSFNGYTGIGSPPIFGGYESTPLAVNARSNVTLKQKHNEALLMMPMLFSSAGYSVTATDSPYANYSEPSDMRIYDSIPNAKGYITDSVYTNTWLKEHNIEIPSLSETLKRNIIFYSLLRASPYFLREGIYMDGKWCSLIDNRHLLLTINGYAVLDYLPRLTDFNTDSENTVITFVNNTTHEGSSLQAPDYRPVTFVNNFGLSPFRLSPAYHVNAASIKRLSDWFNCLKENNAYNNTRIIIVSDHGPETNIVTKTDMPINVDQFNPLLMVKDFNASGAIRTDNTFMSNADVPTLALKNLIDNPVNPYTGNAINMNAKQKPLYIAVSGSIFLGDPNETQIRINPKKDYYVHDNIFDPSNWEKAEK